MRKTCRNKGCNNVLEPTAKAGARNVYCIPCDRKGNRIRMRNLRAKRTAAKVGKLYYRPKHGCVYVIYNPNFKGWLKVGCALDAEDRLNAFQTADPYRGFQLLYFRTASNKLRSETQVHDELTKLYERKGEWFFAKPNDVIKIIGELEWN